MTEKLTPAAEAFRDALEDELKKTYWHRAHIPDPAYFTMTKAARLFDAREREHQEEIERLKSEHAVYGEIQNKLTAAWGEMEKAGISCATLAEGIAALAQSMERLEQQRADGVGRLRDQLDVVEGELIRERRVSDEARAEVAHLKREHAAEVEKAERDIAYLYRVARMRTEQVNEAESRLAQAMEALRLTRAKVVATWCYDAELSEIAGVIDRALLAPPAEKPETVDSPNFAPRELHDFQQRGYERWNRPVLCRVRLDDVHWCANEVPCSSHPEPAKEPER